MHLPLPDQALPTQVEQPLSTAYTDLLLQHTTELIALVDAMGRYRFVTPSYQQLGYTTDEMVGKLSSDFIHPEDRLTALERWQTAQRTGTARVTLRFRCSDGGWRQIACIIHRVHYQGEWLSVLVGRDVTALYARKEHLLEAQRAHLIGALATGVAHDLNNLLTVISGNAELVAGMLPANHPAQADLATITAISTHAGTLTSQVLTYAQQQHLEQGTVDLAELLEDHHALINRLAGAHVEVQFDLPPDLWQVIGVSSQLAQVVLNLVANAHDAMPDGGRITLRAFNLVRTVAADEPPREYVCLEVIDTGIGINPDVQRHLFEPFYSTRSATGGMGLGLATCRRIVEWHGGAIHLASAVGRGTTFSITLPRAEC
jgi:PAS domain S-box-containing protein